MNEANRFAAKRGKNRRRLLAEVTVARTMRAWTRATTAHLGVRN